MWIQRPALAVALVMMTGLPALAQPIEIATLGRAPLMSTSTSLSELRSNFEKNQAMMQQAAHKLGLTDEQYETFKLQVAVAKARWVTVPRHLEAMSWASDGTVHVLHDVIIPPNMKGIEVDMPDRNSTLAMFLPAKCGNLSYVHLKAPTVAYPSSPHYVSAAQSFPQPRPQQVAAVVTGTVPVAPLAAIPPPPIVAAAAHHFSLLPLAALLPFVVHSGNNVIPAPPGVTSISGPAAPNFPPPHSCGCPPPPCP
jgi:hypothetical protein